MDAKHIGLGLNIEVVEGDVELKAVSDILQEKRRKCKGRKVQSKNSTPRVKYIGGKTPTMLRKCKLSAKMMNREALILMIVQKSTEPKKKE